jgi:hypothetical protein
MRMCVCAYVPMAVCVRPCISLCHCMPFSVCLCLCMHVCVCACVFVCLCLCECVSVCLSVSLCVRALAYIQKRTTTDSIKSEIFWDEKAKIFNKSIHRPKRISATILGGISQWLAELSLLPVNKIISC